MEERLPPTRKLPRLPRTESFVERSQKSEEFVREAGHTDNLDKIKAWVEEMNASNPRPHPKKHPCSGCVYLHPVWLAGRRDATATTTCTRFPPTTNGTHEAHYPDVTKLPRACGEYTRTQDQN